MKPDRHSILLWFALAALIGLVVLAWIVSSRGCALPAPPEVAEPVPSPPQEIQPPSPIPCNRPQCQPKQFCLYDDCICNCAGNGSCGGPICCRYNCQYHAACNEAGILPANWEPGISTCGSPP